MNRMQALQALLRRNRDAWPYAVAAGMLLLAGALWLVGVRPLAAENQRLDDVAAEALRRPRNVVAVDQGPVAQYRAYEARLPRADTAVDMASRIYQAGTNNGIQLPTGEYRLERMPDERLLRYRINLPVSGSYPQIRAFVLEVLRTVPAAALDDIQLRRDASGGQLEARVRFSLYLLPS
jgi:hypothetical protein